MQSRIETVSSYKGPISSQGPFQISFQMNVIFLGGLVYFCSIVLTAVPSTMSLQTGLSPLPSLKSSRLSTTTWPIRSCLEKRSKSYTEKCSFLECSSFNGTPNWKVSLNTGFKVFLWTWDRQIQSSEKLQWNYFVRFAVLMKYLLGRYKGISTGNKRGTKVLYSLHIL